MRADVGHMPPSMQPDAVVSEANPNSGEEYEVLATTSNVRIISINAYVAWTGQPNPLQVHVYIDGQEIIFNQANPVTVTAYYAYIHANAALNAQLFGGANFDHRSYLLEGKTIRVTVETTGGVVQNLDCRMHWQKWE